MINDPAKDGKRLAQATWGASPTGWAAAKDLQPGTKAFFDKAITARRAYEMPWLPEVVPFATFREKRVLEIGFGPGYDALTFCEIGALYSGIDITAENVERARNHLGAYGFTPEIRQGDAEELPFADNTFDLAFSNGVLHHVTDIDRALREAHRVVKPGGDAIFILYNRDSIFYRVTLDLWQHRIHGGSKEMSLDDRLRSIEANEAGHKPLVSVRSPSSWAAMVLEAGFVVPNTQVRKLVWEDLPLLPAVWRLYRFIPRGLLDWLGRRWGWYVIVQAKKP